MVIFRYSKVDGAEYLSHLDMLRHLNKIIRRAGINAAYSKGYNPHMNIYMSSPIGVGIKSEGEYCLVNCDVDAHEFIEKFNSATFRGVRCLKAFNVEKKVNVAGIINRALYEIEGVNQFDTAKVMESQSFEITDKKGRRREVRQKIFDMRFENGKLYATIGFGNEALRPDLFGNELALIYGGAFKKATKKDVFVDNLTFDEYIKNLKSEEVGQ